MTSAQKPTPLRDRAVGDVVSLGGGRARRRPLRDAVGGTAEEPRVVVDGGGEPRRAFQTGGTRGGKRLRQTLRATARSVAATVVLASGCGSLG